MESLAFRIHVAIIAFAVGMAANMVWGMLSRPLSFGGDATRVAKFQAPPDDDDPPPVIAEADADPSRCAGVEEDAAELRPIIPNVVSTKAYSKPVPVYPPEAKEARVSGPVSVRITVDEEGRVIKARAVSGHPLLHAAARDAACRARFSPTLLSGRPVSVEGVISYNFVLQ